MAMTRTRRQDRAPQRQQLQPLPVEAASSAPQAITLSDTGSFVVTEEGIERLYAWVEDILRGPVLTKQEFNVRALRRRERCRWRARLGGVIEESCLAGEPGPSISLREEEARSARAKQRAEWEKEKREAERRTRTLAQDGLAKLHLEDQKAIRDDFRAARIHNPQTPLGQPDRGPAEPPLHRYHSQRNLQRDGLLEKAYQQAARQALGFSPTASWKCEVVPVLQRRDREALRRQLRGDYPAYTDKGLKHLADRGRYEIDLSGYLTGRGEALGEESLDDIPDGRGLRGSRIDRPAVFERRIERIQAFLFVMENLTDRRQRQVYLLTRPWQERDGGGRRSYTQTEIAEKLGCSQGLVSRINKCVLESLRRLHRRWEQERPWRGRAVEWWIYQRDQELCSYNKPQYLWEDQRIRYSKRLLQRMKHHRPRFFCGLLRSLPMMQGDLYFELTPARLREAIGHLAGGEGLFWDVLNQFWDDDPFESADAHWERWVERGRGGWRSLEPPVNGAIVEQWQELRRVTWRVEGILGWR